MDLKGVLDDKEPTKVIEQNNLNDDKNIRVHKKPLQLRDIENRSSNRRKVKTDHESDEQIKDMLIKEKEEVYKQNWNKLDLGMKINRLKIHFDELETQYSLNSEQKEKLRILLMSSCSSGNLNKISDVTYDKEQCRVISIKNLILNSETKEFKLEIVESKKTKVSSSKSRSNIDRFLKKR